MPSKHANAAPLIRRGLFDGLSTFVELERRISALGEQNTKLVGDAFEIFVEAFLATHQKMQVSGIWLVGYIPSDIRQQLNLPKDTKGIDGIFITRSGTLVPYQVKFRSQRAYLTYTEVAPFLGLTERATDRVIFTNSNELAADVKNRDAMRTVRGIDFDDLTKDDFTAISGWLREQPLALAKPTPKSYQVEALKKISETLLDSDRAHVVMACGTGKTLVALWSAESLRPKTVLVLVPSLTLLQQTLDEWSRHNNWGHRFTYLCVCSDPTVVSKDENDPVRLDAADLEFRVDTSPDEVRRFIEQDTPSVKVIFSTYQSSPVVSAGAQGLAPFDVAILDEAHKTTGLQGDRFAHCLSENNVRIRKRLFFTATPRHYDIRHRDKQGDFRVVSMDDQLIYGPRAYTLTFGSAARQGIICNYKVVISVVDGPEVNNFALRHGITLVEGDLIGARWVANQIAVERAIRKTAATRAITFHSRVSSAETFSSDGTRGIKRYLADFSVLHVNGSQKSAERKQIIRSFRNAEKAIITNARCLTEGIDVPAVDMVAFIDPRNSKVDIAQATGRAIRKPRGSDKQVGYVVIPLFLDKIADETLDQALERSDFSDAANVLNAMQEQDEDLVETIRELRVAKGRGEIFDPCRLSEKVQVLGPSIELATLQSSIYAEIVDRIGVSWDEWYGRLEAFQQREGHCRVPALHRENGLGLGGWVDQQRQNKKTLSKERRQRLDALGFVWDPHDADWEVGFGYLKSYKQREGHCRVAQAYKEGDGYRLGAWADHQRQKKDSLSDERLRKLNDIGFDWDPLKTAWEEGFRRLIAYKDREGHYCVPGSYKEEDGYRLGQWVAVQRTSQNTLTPSRRQRLDEIGFNWAPREGVWENAFRLLKRYKDREGHCSVPVAHKEDGFGLGQWVINQRAKRSTLTPERQRKLDEIGFDWDPFEKEWEEGFRQLTLYKEREGNCRVPQEHNENGFRLGQWVSVQRTSRNTLGESRRQKLDEIGFSWNPRDEAWDEGLRHLKLYREREGHCSVPVGGSLQEHGSWRVPSPQPSQSELCSSRPRRRGEGE
jgi:superfamily II DNA or RNA helicase